MSPRTIFLTLALLFLSAPAVLAQQDAIRVFPPGPTPETPITLSFTTSCPRGDTFTVDKRADEVILIAKADGTCGSPPIDHTYYIPIGTLPAGSYRIAYTYQGSGEVFYQTQRINVRPAEAPAPFDIHPRAIRTNPAGLRLRIAGSESLCHTPNCDTTTITVGGVAVTNVEIVAAEEGHAVTFAAPARPVGFADVIVQTPSLTWTFPKGVYYFDSPDPSIFERILFPVLFTAPGANGSNWLSEAVVSNPNPWFVDNFNEIELFVCISFPCGERLSPGSYSRISGGNDPHGVALLVPRSEADGLAFALRARDTSRQADSFGTEIPVVREKDMAFNKATSLLEVPLDSRFRVKVRVYAFDSQFAGIKLMNPETKVVKTERFVQLSKPCDTCAAYGELDLEPGAAADERVAIYVTTADGSLSWAFAAVTNNSTQQVTVVTPAGGSGEP